MEHRACLHRVGAHADRRANELNTGGLDTMTPGQRHCWALVGPSPFFPASEKTPLRLTIVMAPLPEAEEHKQKGFLFFFCNEKCCCS